VLAAWSSFDDPVTVLLVLYAPLLFAGAGLPVVEANPDAALYALHLGGNLLLAGGAWVLWRLAAGRALLGYLVLGLCGVIAVLTGWLLAVALIGLFARPPALERALPAALTGAFALAAVALGVLLVDGVAFARGASLGVAAFGAQLVVAWPLTRRLALLERWHLALAQQNGITAMLLALALEPSLPGAVATIAPAILVANVLHALANRAFDARWGARLR
jgi:hypothetical protein